MTRRFRAGCGREQDGPSDLFELAYLDLAFAECDGCRHRIHPTDGPDFCRWLATDREAPFARLADLVDRHGGGGST